MCAGAPSCRLLKCGNYDITATVCALWSRANISNTQPSHWRMQIFCGERGGAVLTSWGQVANSFHCEYPLLPSSSSYSLHPLTDLSDQGSALVPLYPNTKQPSLSKRRGWEGQELDIQRWELCKHQNDQQTTHGQWTTWVYLPNLCKDLSVMRMRKPVGADSRYVLCSSDHCHISERRSCRAQTGGRTSSEEVLKAETAK